MSPANTMSDEALASSSAKGPSPSANEPFVLLANGTRGAAAIGLVRQVLEAPGVFVFGELLDHPNVRALGDDSSSTADGPKYFHLLELFAYGTYQEYQSQKTALPPLTDAMTKKLRLLTLASLATGRRLLSYDKLLKELQINNVRELEDVIIEGASANVVQGKLDQKERHFEVDFTMARDIRMSEVKNVISTLDDWCKSCDTMLDCLEAQADRANATKADGIAHRSKVEQKVAEIRGQLKQTEGSDDPDSRMDTDRSGEGRKDKKGGKGKSSRSGGGKQGGFWK